jgi:RES domain-containing protein
VYFGAGAAIVVLEKLAHLNPDTLPADLILGLFEADVSVEDVWAEGSSQNHDLGNIDQTRAAGREWIESGRSCVLRVPSMVLPEEQNLVVNPLHTEAPRIALTTERPFTFDGRLL